jgi:hypothetical protein
MYMMVQQEWLDLFLADQYKVHKGLLALKEQQELMALTVLKALLARQASRAYKELKAIKVWLVMMELKAPKEWLVPQEQQAQLVMLDLKGQLALQEQLEQQAPQGLTVLMGLMEVTLLL